jgi:hypothetical protein
MHEYKFVYDTQKGIHINMSTHWEYKLLKLRYSYTDVVCVSPPHNSKSLVANSSSYE